MTFFSLFIYQDLVHDPSNILLTDEEDETETAETEVSGNNHHDKQHNGDVLGEPM